MCPVWPRASLILDAIDAWEGVIMTALISRKMFSSPTVSITRGYASRGIFDRSILKIAHIVKLDMIETPIWLITAMMSPSLDFRARNLDKLKAK
jgi:hypothetical protein